MLKRLHIDNYALIESSEIDFESGFTVITGETGAGKSILLGALGLLMGDKVESKYFKDAEKKCVIEATFDLSNYNLQSFFDENELEYDDETIVRKEIQTSGKARQFVNDSPVSLSVLKSLGDRLIDIHSQHQNLLIKDDEFQLSVVDAVADTKIELEQYAAQYKNWKKLSQELEKLKLQQEQDRENQDYLESQLEKLTSANLVEGEQTELEEEQNVLSNADTIRESLGNAYWNMEDDDSSIASRLKESINSMNKVADMVSGMEELVERSSSLLADIKDISATLSDYIDKVDSDPKRLEFIQQRLDTIYTLERRFKVDSVEELIQTRKDLEKRVARFTSSSEELEDLEKEVEKARKELSKSAKNLSDKRKNNADKIADSIVQNLVEMGMPASKLKVEVSQIDGFSPLGIDEVRFLFSANKDKTLLPISDIASGGEISRVMLSLKNLLSQVSSLPTVILDEIDTGISGEVAGRMGKVMKKMATRMQVISITHLPQIAAQGDNHFMVFKADKGEKIVSSIKLLSQDERVDEIAQMLSGASPTDAARANARELMNK
ncbi:MAG: DNA repair protein RecN [Paludibacteraceae bacterium]|nr:DNA repair protein RecN [Paludibacteraceae bacterium]